MDMVADHHQLLSELGKQIGIPDIKFDQAGFCCLGFDEVVLNIEYSDPLKHLLIYSAIGQMPPVAGEAYLLRLLELNYASLVMGTGAVGVNSDAGVISFVERVPLRGLSSQGFEAIIQSIVNRVEALQKQIATLATGTASNGSDATHDSSMLRI